MGCWQWRGRTDRPPASGQSWRGAAGRWIEAQRPRPASEWRRSLPPMASVSSRAIGRPRPAPSDWRVRASAPCSNGRRIRCKSWIGTPGPLSTTSKATLSRVVRRQRRTNPPSGEKAMALWTSWVRAVLSPRSSARTQGVGAGSIDRRTLRARASPARVSATSSSTVSGSSGRRSRSTTPASSRATSITSLTSLSNFSPLARTISACSR